MRSASLLPSTPAGLRGSERLTVLFLVGLSWGCFGARVFRCGVLVRCGASRCRRVLGPGWPWGAGRCGAGASPNPFFFR